MFYLMIILFVVGYLCIALEHPLKVNKAAFALFLGVMMWVLYVIAGEGIFDITHYKPGLRSSKPITQIRRIRSSIFSPHMSSFTIWVTLRRFFST